MARKSSWYLTTSLLLARLSTWMQQNARTQCIAVPCRNKRSPTWSLRVSASSTNSACLHFSLGKWSLLRKKRGSNQISWSCLNGCMKLDLGLPQDELLSAPARARTSAGRHLSEPHNALTGVHCWSFMAQESTPRPLSSLTSLPTERILQLHRLFPTLCLRSSLPLKLDSTPHLRQVRMLIAEPLKTCLGNGQQVGQHRLLLDLPMQRTGAKMSEG